MRFVTTVLGHARSTHGSAAGVEGAEMTAGLLVRTLAKKKEMTMSQMASLVRATMACLKVRVLVTSTVVRPRKAQAPTGRGSRTRPAVMRACA